MKPHKNPPTGRLLAVGCSVLLASYVSLCMFGDGIFQSAAQLLNGIQSDLEFRVISYLDTKKLAVHLVVISHPLVILNQSVSI